MDKKSSLKLLIYREISFAFDINKAEGITNIL